MKTKIYLLTGLIAVLIIAISAVIIPKVSAASCYGTSCRGKDPNSEGCHYDKHWDNYSEHEILGVGKVRVEIRHSHTCGAFWTKVISENPDASYLLGKIFEYPAGYYYHYRPSLNSYYDGYIYTDMVSGLSGVTGYSYGWLDDSYFSGENGDVFAWTNYPGH